MKEWICAAAGTVGGLIAGCLAAGMQQCCLYRFLWALTT